MKAAVLAAGQGTRLLPMTETMPKSMLELAPGKTIMDSIIDNLEEIGVEEIVIVTRPEFSHLFSQRYKGRVKIIESEYEDSGNLYSLEVAAQQLGTDGEILVVMSDHVFGMKMLKKLVEKERSKPITICVDRNPPWDTVQEGLKIRLEEDKVIELGKDAPPHHGTDTGLFAFSKEIWPLVQETRTKLGLKAEIIDLLKEARRLDLIGYADVTGCIWVDVDTPQDLEKAKHLYWVILRRNLIKPSDGLVSRYINRPISTRISLYLYRKGIKMSPNLITFLIFLFGLASALVLAQGRYIIGGLMVFLLSMLDGVDGEVARLRGETTAFGGFLDSVLDRCADLMIVVSLAYSIGWVANTFGALMLTLATAGVFIHSYIVHVAQLRGLNISQVEKAFPLASRDVRLFAVTLFCLASLPSISLLLLAILPLIYTLVAFIKLREEKVRGTKLVGKTVSAMRTLAKPTILAEYEFSNKDKTLQDIRANITLLLLNVVKLAVSLLVLNFLRFFDDIVIFTLGNFTFTTTMLLNLLRMVAIIVFGYKILLALNFFFGISSDYVVRRLGITLAAYRRFALDLVYLFGIVLLWMGIVPIIRSSTGIAHLVTTLTTVILLALLLLITYDLVKIFRRSLTGIWHNLIDKVLKFFEKIL